jgi:hypothetical protein
MTHIKILGSTRIQIVDKRNGNTGSGAWDHFDERILDGRTDCSYRHLSEFYTALDDKNTHRLLMAITTEILEVKAQYDKRVR